MPTEFHQGWNRKNEQYWDNVASKYNLLYLNRWNSLENDYISKLLRSLRSCNSNILDLGCGTGLGLDLLAGDKGISYTGVDISGKMLDELKRKYPNAKALKGIMSDLKLDNDSFDVVISTFTSFSYTDNPTKTFSEIQRVLKPNGKLFISVLGRWSLRRLIAFRFSRKEFYKTRQFKSKDSTFAWTFTVSELLELVKNHNLEVVEIKGYNSFTGTLLQKFIWLWPINKFLSKIFPHLSHELIVIAKNI